jgi:hypothetical protein
VVGATGSDRGDDGVEDFAEERAGVLLDDQG